MAGFFFEFEAVRPRRATAMLRAGPDFNTQTRAAPRYGSSTYLFYGAGSLANYPHFRRFDPPKLRGFCS